jgi:hypothetical protein
MFLIVYARVIDNKKKGLEFEGPFFGPETDTMAEAHEECRKIVTPSKDHVLIKVFDLDEDDYYSAKDTAQTHFERVYEQMQSAQELCDTPRKRKK